MRTSSPSTKPRRARHCESGSLTTRTYSGWFENASKVIADWIGPPCIVVFCVIVYQLAKGHFGTIARLSQVRITPVSVDGVRGPPREFTRLVHGGHLIGLGVFPRYRDVETDKVHLFRKSENFGEHHDIRSEAGY